MKINELEKLLRGEPISQDAFKEFNDYCFGPLYDENQFNLIASILQANEEQAKALNLDIWPPDAYETIIDKVINSNQTECLPYFIKKCIQSYEENYEERQYYVEKLYELLMKVVELDNPKLIVIDQLLAKGLKPNGDYIRPVVQKGDVDLLKMLVEKSEFSKDYEWVLEEEISTDNFYLKILYNFQKLGSISLGNDTEESANKEYREEYRAKAEILSYLINLNYNFDKSIFLSTVAYGNVQEIEETYSKIELTYNGVRSAIQSALQHDNIPAFKFLIEKVEYEFISNNLFVEIIPQMRRHPKEIIVFLEEAKKLYVDISMESILSGIISENDYEIAYLLFSNYFDKDNSTVVDRFLSNVQNKYADETALLKNAATHNFQPLFDWLGLKLADFNKDDDLDRENLNDPVEDSVNDPVKKILNELDEACKKPDAEKVEEAIKKLKQHDRPSPYGRFFDNDDDIEDDDLSAELRSLMMFIPAKNEDDWLELNKVIKLLMDSGAKVNSAILGQMIQFNPEAPDLIWDTLFSDKHCCDSEMLITAIRGRNSKAIFSLLKHGVNFSTDDISLALSYGLFEVATYLVENFNMSENTPEDEKGAIENIKQTMKAAENARLYGLSRDEYLQLSYLADTGSSNLLWESMHNIAIYELFSEHENFSPYRFNTKVYTALLSFTRMACALESNSGEEIHAYQLTVLFGSYQDALEYLKKYESEHPDSKQPVHDACLSINIPVKGVWDTDVWSKKVEKFGLKMGRLMKFAPVIEKHIHYHPPMKLNEKFIKEKEQEFATKYDADIAKKESALKDRSEKNVLSKTKHNQIVLTAEELAERAQEKRYTYIQQKTKEAISHEMSKRLKTQTKKELKMQDPGFAELVKLAQKKSQDKNEQQEIVAAKTAVKVRIDQEIAKRDLSKITYQDVLAIVSEISYKRAKENAVFAQQCLAAGLSEENFNECLDTYSCNNKTEDKLPNLFVDGAELGQPEYYFQKLPANDTRGFILGFYTNCCQSMGDNAEKVALHGMTSNKSGFYVIMKKATRGKCDITKDKIVAQSWGWISVDGNLVFDSLELLQPSKGKDFLQFYYRAAEQALNHSFTDSKEDRSIPYLTPYPGNFTVVYDNENDETADSTPVVKKITRVTLGKGGATPDDVERDSAYPPEDFIGPKLYGDSNEQWLLADVNASVKANKSP